MTLYDSGPWGLHERRVRRPLWERAQGPRAPAGNAEVLPGRPVGAGHRRRIEGRDRVRRLL